MPPCVQYSSIQSPSVVRNLSNHVCSSGKCASLETVHSMHRRRKPSMTTQRDGSHPKKNLLINENVAFGVIIKATLLLKETLGYTKLYAALYFFFKTTVKNQLL